MCVQTAASLFLLGFALRLLRPLVQRLCVVFCLATAVGLAASWACKFVASTDCADSMCVYGAILNFTEQVTSASGTQQLDALKFVTHFVGDIHQVGTRCTCGYSGMTM